MRLGSAVMVVVGESLLYLAAFEEEWMLQEVVAVLQSKGGECLYITRQRKDGSVVDGYIRHSPGNSNISKWPGAMQNRGSPLDSGTAKAQP